MPNDDVTKDTRPLAVWSITRGNYTKDCVTADGKVRWGAWEHQPTEWHFYGTDAAHALLRAREFGVVLKGIEFHFKAVQVTDHNELALLTEGGCVV